MRIFFKEYADGLTLRIEGVVKPSDRAKLIKKFKKALDDKPAPVTTFDEPLPDCAPDQPKCN